MNKNNIEKIFYQFNKLNPNPKTDLKFKTKFELLISVILSAQATDKSVNKVTKELFKNYNTPEKISKLGESRLKKKIKTILKMPNNLFVQKLSTKITDSMVGFAFKVYIGNKFILVKVNQSMVGHFFGEFVKTRKFHIFKKNK